LTNAVAIAAATVGNLALTASDGPPLLGRPLHTLGIAGTTARLRALAVGLGPLTYQWVFNGTNLPDATNATLTLTNLQFSQAGTYFVIVSNAFGAVSNSAFNFGVLPLFIRFQP